MCLLKFPVKASNASSLVKLEIFSFFEIKFRFSSTNLIYLSGAYQSSSGSEAPSEGNSSGYFPVNLSTTSMPLNSFV